MANHTNWKFEPKSINDLILSVIFSYISYLLVRIRQYGSYNSEQRIQLTEWLITNFKHIKIK